MGTCDLPHGPPLVPCSKAAPHFRWPLPTWERSALLPQGSSQASHSLHVAVAEGGLMYQEQSWGFREDSLEERSLVWARDRRTFWQEGWRGHLRIFDSRTGEGVSCLCWDLVTPMG